MQLSIGIKNILFQFLVSKGINLNNVIHHENDDLSSLLNDNYWIFILKWLYNRQDSLDYVCKDLLELIQIIENNFQRLKKTAKLLIALERREEIDLNDDFYPLILHAPGQIFSPLDEEELFISPIIIALANQDVQLLNHLTLHPSFNTKPLFYDISKQVFESKSKIDWKNRLITLLLNMLRKEPSFFQRKQIVDFLSFHVSSNQDTFYEYLTAAQIFLFCEENEFDRAKDLIQNEKMLSFMKDAMVTAETYLNGSRQQNTSNLIRKTLVLTTIEKRNITFLKFLISKNFDVTNLGEPIHFWNHDPVKQKMHLWYLLVKFLLQAGEVGIPILEHLSTMPQVKKGPYLVGCLFFAITIKNQSSKNAQPDVQLLQEIKTHFGAQWLTFSDYSGKTVQTLLNERGLIKESEMLSIYLGSGSEKKSTKEDMMKKISEHSSFEEFKSFILSNPTILSDVVTGNTIFMHMFVVSKEFTEEKMLFLLEQNAVIDKSNIYGQNIMGILIKEINSIGTKNEALLYLGYNLSVLIALGRENENLHSIIASNTNLLKDMTHLIEKYKTSQILVDSLKNFLEYPIFDFSSMFYPTERGKGVFSFTNSESEVMELFIVKGIDSLVKEEDKMPSIMALIRECIYCHTINEMKGENQYLYTFFSLLFKTLESNNMSLKDLRNKYDITFLMSLLITSTVTKQRSVFEEELENLIEWILKEEYFEDDNISHKTNYELSAQFDLSHIHGIAKKSKAKNTVLDKNQLIPLKRVNRLNPDTGKYEKVSSEKPGQEKMLAKRNVKMIDEDGKVCEKRPMITVNCPSEPREEEALNEREDYFAERNSLVDDDSFEDNASVGVISDDDEELDMNNSNPNPLSGLDESIDNDFITKCVEWKNVQSTKDLEQTIIKVEKWTLDQPDVQKKKRIKEHFDRSSVKSLSKETFKTKINKYKYAPSASTKFTDTYLEEETPSDLICRNTTLFLMACKANKWNIVMALLKLDPQKYPSLLQNSGKMQSRHPLYHQDDHCTNPLLLALQSEQIEICQIMIEIIDAHTLKTCTIYKDKTILKYVTEEMSGSNSQKLLIECIEAKIGKKKKKKAQNKRVKMKGSSCGFMFQSLDPTNWKCIQCDARVKTRGNDDIIFISDNNHYQR